MKTPVLLPHIHLPLLAAASLLCSPALLRAEDIKESKGSSPSPASAAPAQEGATTPPKVTIDPAPVQTKPGFITSFAPVVEKVAPSVVTISTSKKVKKGASAMPNHPMFNDPAMRRFFGLPEGDEEETPKAPGRKRNPQNGQQKEETRKQSMGLGSGVIVSAEGHVLTNNHVIEGADEIEVTIGSNGATGHKYKATKVAADPGTDIAVLKIEAKNLRPMVFADSEKVRVGDIVVAVGNPFNLTQSVSMGVVSATGRGGMGIVDYENFIQTDASINPGNSGGALVDIEGRLIGINTAIFSRTGGNLGIGFAVPANLARSTMESLIKNGRVVRGYLGVGIQDLTEDLAQKFNLPEQTGALVNRVENDGPAGKAGVQNGDIILEVNGRKIEGTRELRLMVSGIAPGSTVQVKVLRKGKQQVVPVKLAEMPAKAGAPTTSEPQEEEAPDVLDGVSVQDLTPAVRKELGIDEKLNGVAIMAVDPDSPSAAAGLKRGDVIMEIEQQSITSAKQAEELSEKIKNQKQVLLRVSTKGQTRYVVVKDKE